MMWFALAIWFLTSVPAAVLVGSMLRRMGNDH